MLYVNHTGATSASGAGILSEFMSVATDATTILKVTGSTGFAAGTILNVSGAALTTGTGILMTGANVLTTGSMISLTCNSSDTSARSMIYLHQDHASAVGAVPITIVQDAVTSTYFKIALVLAGVTIWVSDGTHSPNSALTATAGDMCLNGDSGKTYYCTGTNAWTAYA
jgi:hypothetical protein